MNRRNFLKLLGLSALPIPALAALPEPVPEPRKLKVQWNTANELDQFTPKHEDWLILETPFLGLHDVEIDNQGVYGHDSYMADSEDAVFYRHGLNTSQFLKVTEKSKVYVTSPEGQRVWFHPEWNPVYERFETVVIETETFHDIYISDNDDANSESKATIMSARTTDGKLISQSAKEWSNES